MLTSEKNLFIWAIDPFEPDSTFTQPVLKELSVLNESFHSKILPVSVVSTENLSWPEAVKTTWPERLRKLTETSVQELLQDAKIEGLTSTEVLIQDGLSETDSVKTIVNFAEKNQAQVIIASTHSHQGLTRWILGSFTETLLVNSTLPVLTINPKAEVASRIGRIIYSTDFSHSSQRGFKELLLWCQSLNCELTLFSGIEEPVVIGDPMTPIIPSLDLAEEIEQSRRNIASTWKRLADDVGVPCHILIKKSFGELTDLLFETAKFENAQMISYSLSEARKNYLGRISKNIVRFAKVPVLTFPHGNGLQQ